ncbi:MAG: SURF1 family protein [Pseudomonadota bacterium]
MGRYLFPIALGVSGLAVLLWLGFWQVARLEWKEDILAQLEARLNTKPLPLEQVIDPVTSLAERNYTAVRAEISLTGQEAHVYAPTKSGLGYRVVAPALWQGRKILIDLGWIPEAAKNNDRAALRMRVIGNLLVPDDFNERFTPDPDLEKNIWFARHLPPMAAHFAAEDVLIVVRSVEGMQNGMWDIYDAVTPLPVSPQISNDHREYAITWFSLAAVWLGMTLFWILRIRRRKNEPET